VAEKAGTVDSGGIVGKTVGNRLERTDRGTKYLPGFHVVDPEVEGSRTDTHELGRRQHLPVDEARRERSAGCRARGQDGPGTSVAPPEGDGKRSQVLDPNTRGF
jgi:hypothetical protein